MPAANPSSTAVARPCPLCGAMDRKVLTRRDPWEIVECARCSMVFIGSELAYDVQARDHDWMDEHAKAASERKQKQPLMVLLSRLLRPLRPNTNGRMVLQTLRWRRAGQLVDFGCGDAGFLLLASKHFDVTGIELSPRGVELSRQRISPDRILEGPVTKVASALPENSYDVVTQFGYIEHEWQPIAGLGAAYRIFKPGGVTVMRRLKYRV